MFYKPLAYLKGIYSFKHSDFREDSILLFSGGGTEKQRGYLPSDFSVWYPK